MKKSKRPKASKREHEVDFMSKMPDAILLMILSRLPSTKQVIRTSVLSSRWRYLWTSVPSIEIRCEGNLTADEFREFVYWILVIKSVDLDRFCLSLSYDYSISEIGRWIYAAVTRKIKQLELTFCPEETDDIMIPNCLVACRSLEVFRLNLRGHGLRLPKINGFAALRVLDLSCVNLLEDGKLVQEFLESCPLLEDLTLSGCLMGNLKYLYILCSNLKKLTISNQDIRRMCSSIKISCPKLVDLDLRGCIAYNYLFKRLDSLKEAVIRPFMATHPMSSMFPAFYHVESLFIGFRLFTECISTASDPSLPYLKTLKLTTGYDFKFDKFVQILEYYPKLESLKLIVKQYIFAPEVWMQYGGDARRFWTGGNEDLKGVEFLEYNGEKPKLVMEWYGITSLKIEVSWGV